MLRTQIHNYIIYTLYLFDFYFKKSTIEHKSELSKYTIGIIMKTIDCFTPKPNVLNYVKSLKPVGKREFTKKPKRHRRPRTVETLDSGITAPKVDLKTVPLEDIFKITQIKCQRQIDKARMRRLINNFLGSETYSRHTAMLLTAVHLPNGKIFLVDGNHRVQTWYDEIVKAEETGVAPSIEIPRTVNLLTHYVATKEEAERVYYSLDNSGATEKAKDKIGGAFDSLDLVFTHDLITSRGFSQGAKDVALLFPSYKVDKICEERSLVAFFEEELNLINERIKFKKASLGKEIMGPLLAILRKNRGNKKEIDSFLTFVNHVGMNTGDYACNGKKNAVTFLIAEYNPDNKKRRFPHKSAYRRAVIGLWLVYYDDWKKKRLRTAKCYLTEQSLRNKVIKYFK